MPALWRSYLRQLQCRFWAELGLRRCGDDVLFGEYLRRRSTLHNFCRWYCWPGSARPPSSSWSARLLPLVKLLWVPLSGFRLASVSLPTAESSLVPEFQRRCVPGSSLPWAPSLPWSSTWRPCSVFTVSVFSVSSATGISDAVGMGKPVEFFPGVGQAVSFNVGGLYGVGLGAAAQERPCDTGMADNGVGAGFSTPRGLGACGLPLRVSGLSGSHISPASRLRCGSVGIHAFHQSDQRRLLLVPNCNRPAPGRGLRRPVCIVSTVDGFPAGRLE